jgi:hypothetical protein
LIRLVLVGVRAVPDALDDDDFELFQARRATPRSSRAFPATPAVVEPLVAAEHVQHGAPRGRDGVQGQPSQQAGGGFGVDPEREQPAGNDEQLPDQARRLLDGGGAVDLPPP